LLKYSQLMSLLHLNRKVNQEKEWIIFLFDDAAYDVTLKDAAHREEGSQLLFEFVHVHAPTHVLVHALETVA